MPFLIDDIAIAAALGLAGAGVGVGANALANAPATARSRERRIADKLFSPWTGMQPEALKESSMLNDMLAGGGAGLSFGMNMIEKDAISKAAEKAATSTQELQKAWTERLKGAGATATPINDATPPAPVGPQGPDYQSPNQGMEVPVNDEIPIPFKNRTNLSMNKSSPWTLMGSKSFAPNQRYGSNLNPYFV